METPNGINEIINAYGNVAEYIRTDGTLDPEWERRYIASVPIPISLPLAWDKRVRVSSIRVNKALVDTVRSTFDAIVDRGLDPQLRTYGGAYTFRAKRGIAKYSTHSWGIAIDLNPETNQMGARGDMSIDVVNVFREFGWKWGGDWRGANCDPMHFQFCTGY